MNDLRPYFVQKTLRLVHALVENRYNLPVLEGLFLD